MMKCLILAIGLCISMSLTARAQENLVANGDFEQDLGSWMGQKLSAEDDSKGIPAPEIISWEQKDVAHGSKGALKYTLKEDPQFFYRSHNSGAICTLTEIVPAGKTLKIIFQAKGLEGSSILSIARSWGGASATVRLGNNWDKYEIKLKMPYETSSLTFSLVPKAKNEIQACAEGSFLLDDVMITSE